MRRSSLVGWVLAACLSVQLGGCRPAAEAGGAGPVLKVGGQKGATRALLEGSGALQGAPYRIEWSEFAAAAPLLEAIGDGAVDVGGVGDAPFVFAYAAGAPIQAVFAYRTGGQSTSSTAVLTPATSPIRTPADLRGRKVATVRGSVGHYLLIRVLQANGVDPKSVQVVYLDPGSSRGALSSGAVDAWSTWSPYVGYGLLHDHDRKLVDGRGLMHGVGFMAANRASIAAKAPLLADFDRRLARAYAWGRAHPDGYARRISAETGLPQDVALDMARRLSAEPSPMDAGLVAEERETLAAFAAAGVIDKIPDLTGAFARQFDAALKP